MINDMIRKLRLCDPSAYRDDMDPLGSGRNIKRFKAQEKEYSAIKRNT